jgi:hypothetical protein
LNSTRNGQYVNATHATEVFVDNAGNITNRPNTELWQLPFRIRVTDSAGNQDENTVDPANGKFQSGGTQYFILMDPNADTPKAAITYPNPGDRVGGQVRITGTATDNTWVYAILVRAAKGTSASHDAWYRASPYVTNEDGWGLADITGSKGAQVAWTYTINRSKEFESTGSSTQQSVYIEVLPIDSKQYETYENTGKVPPSRAVMNSWVPDLDHRQGKEVGCDFVIDTSLPSVTNVQIQRAGATAGTFETGVPYADSMKVSGTFKITANVTGSTGINSIQWRSPALTSGTYITMMDWSDSANFIHTNVPETDTTIHTPAHPQWSYTVSMPVNASGASTRITSGSLTPGRKYIISNPGTGTTNWGSVGVGASGDLTTATATRWTTFVAKSATAPGGSNWELYAAGEGDPVTGTISAANNSFTAAQSQRFIYPLTITVFSTVPFPNDGTASAQKPSSGVIGLDIQAEDIPTSGQPSRVQQSMNLRADNYYPTGVYSTPKDVYTNRQYVRGQAIDFDDTKFSGPVYGFDPKAANSKAEVLVYFERNSTYYNPYAIAWVAGNYMTKTVRDGKTGNPDTLTRYPDMSKTIATPAGSLPPDIYTPITLRPAVSINETSNSDVDKDGYIEAFNNAGTGIYDWGFYFDTTRFGDGPITLHYVVIDEAGNATHYSENMYIRNKPPKIGTIKLLTDLNFSHNVNDSRQPADVPTSARPTGASRSYGIEDHRIVDTYFTAKNYRLSFKVDTIDGTGTKNFRVSAVTRGAEMDATQMAVGTVYSIVSGSTDWELAGAPAGTDMLSSRAGVVFTCTTKPTSGNGRVYPYTVIGGSTDPRQKTDTGTGAAATATLNFGNRWNPVTQTTTDNDFVTASVTANRIPDAANNSGFFLVKVYDTTVSGGTENDQQSDLILLGVNLQNLDNQNPDTKIQPFYWIDIRTNSVYDSSKANRVEELKGHIELEEHVKGSASKYTSAGFTADIPKVSGQITILGTVSENTVIDSLWANMATRTTAGTTTTNKGILFTNGTTTNTTEAQIADADGTGGTGGYYYQQIAYYTAANGWTAVDQWANNGWRCTIKPADSVITQSGHEVKFQLDIDTSRHTDLVELNRTLRIKARDVYNRYTPLGGQTTGTAETPATWKNEYAMDIVPYISVIKTTLSEAYSPEPSAFNRSATGRYPVRNGDKVIVRGFNILKNNGTQQTNNGITATLGGLLGAAQTLNGASTAATTYTFAVSAVGSDEDPDDIARWTGKSVSTVIKSTNADVDANANSGWLELTVDGIRAVNNHNDTSTEYNQEPNGTNNQLLTNDRYLYIWNTGSMMPYTAGGTNLESVDNMYNPVMKLDNDGTRYLAYGRYGGSQSGRIRVGKTNTTYDIAYSYSNRTFYIGFALNNANGTFYAAGTDQSSTSNRGFYLGMSSAAGAGTPSNNTNGAAMNPAPNPAAVTLVNENMTNSLGTRFRIPRIAVRSISGSGTRADDNRDRVFISYYDDERKTLNVQYGTIGATTANDIGNSSVGTSGNDQATIVVGDKADGMPNPSGHRGSIYSAAGMLSNGRPILAWYDNTNRRLLLSWGNTPASTNAKSITSQTQWQSNAAIIDTNRGTHVDMAVDGANNVHLAYFDGSNGGLWYALIPYDTANTRPNVDKANVRATVIPVKVDTFLSAGTKITISVRTETAGAVTKYVPYITYVHGSFGETLHSVRVAWRRDFPVAINTTTVNGTNVPAGSDARDSLTQKWEVMTVPASAVPKVDEFISNSVPTILGAGSWSPSPATNALVRDSQYLGNTVVVGYMTENHYEGAILKGNIRP